LSVYNYLESRKRLTYLDSGHGWIEVNNTQGANGRKFLRHAIEYYTRPWAGDVNYDGFVNETDQTEVWSHEDPTSSCPTNPIPGGVVEWNYDVNNDSVVNLTDLGVVAAVRSTYGTPPTFSVALTQCSEFVPEKNFLDYLPSGDCAGTPPPSCQPTCFSGCEDQ
jgi:hypothetical protein